MRTGGSLFLGIILVIIGVILRWDLIDWLIDVTGMLLIIIGVILLIVGVVSMMKGDKTGGAGEGW